MDNKYTNMREGMNPHSTNQTNTFHLFIFSPYTAYSPSVKQFSGGKLKFYDGYVKVYIRHIFNQYF